VRGALPSAVERPEIGDGERVPAWFNALRLRYPVTQMTGDTTIVAGIEIPSVSRVFLTVVGIHVLLGIGCLITGFMAMLSEKRRGRHPQLGTIYYWCLSAVFATATFLSVMRWPEDYHLFILGTLSFTAAFLGRTARRQGSIRLHITAMGLS
jgi:uncharacterized membrane protein